MKHLFRRIFMKSKYLIVIFLVKPFLQIIYRIRYKCIADSEKVLTINVDDILAWETGSIRAGVSFPGVIKSGSWDKKTVSKEIKLKTDKKYIGIKQHFEKGISWENTVLFEKYRSKLKQGVKIGNKDSIDELKRTYEKKMSKLFNSIKENGILPPGHNERFDVAPIYIHIGRKGEIIYTNGGNHRFAMVSILQIQKIHVLVWKRHSEWQKIRDKIISNKSELIPEDLKKYLNHPDIRTEI